MTRRNSRIHRKQLAAPNHPDGIVAALRGIALIITGVACLSGLHLASSLARLSTLPLASKAIYNMIDGMHAVGGGLVQIFTGVFQVVGLAILALISIAAALAVASGALQIGTRLLPVARSFWKPLTTLLNEATLFISPPRSQARNSLKSLRTQPDQVRYSAKPFSSKSAA